VRNAVVGDFEPHSNSDEDPRYDPAAARIGYDLALEMFHQYLVGDDFSSS
jgi:hypothetical protein